jgi:tetratricopeptide (TPR) repeat protein
MLERRGALELEPTRRLALFGEAASLHEASGDLAMAIAAWRSGREGDESNLQALDELARLYEKAGQLEGLVEALTDKSHVIDDNVQRAALYLRIGTLKAGPLADLDGAAAAFREALDLRPEDGVALAALADIEERRGDYTALEEALLRQLSAVSGLGCVPVLTRLPIGSMMRTARWCICTKCWMPMPRIARPLPRRSGSWLRLSAGTS